MSNDIIVARSQAYTDSVQLLLQQRSSRFRAAVMEGHYRGKAAKAVEQIGAVSAQKRTTRHGDTPLIETPHAARWVYPTHYEWADLIDDQDKLETIVELTSPYSINGAAAMTVFEIYIKTTPERLWRAITDPKMRAKYNFGVEIHSDWTPGSSYKSSVPTSLLINTASRGCGNKCPVHCCTSALRLYSTPALLLYSCRSRAVALVLQIFLASRSGVDILAMLL